jgi:CheY-like chemotaxis protein
LKRILIVDDEEDIRDVVELCLEEWTDWKIDTARSGEQCLEKATAHPPDAIILDVMMPGLDGPTTFARLRADETTRDIPVIFLTAKVQSTERRSLEELGARGVIAKPFDPTRLAELVRSILGWD